MKIVICGAGPAGLLLAQSLLQYHERDYEVHLFDKRPFDDRSYPNQDERTYPIAIQGRGMRAIQKVSSNMYENLQNRGKWTDRISFHPTGNSNSAQSIKRPSPVFAIEMADLVQGMLDTVRECKSCTTSYGPVLKTHFNCKVEHVFLNNCTLCTKSEGNIEEFVFHEFDYLIAADGVQSTVRKSVRWTYQENPVPGGYKPMKLLNWLSDKESIHGWMTGSVNVLAAPLKSNYSSAVYAFTEHNDPLEHCGTPRDVLKYVQHNVSKNLVPLISADEARNLLESHVHTLATIQCPSLIMEDDEHKPRIALLGDAGHTFSAALNQGCNVALEDVAVFQQCLESHRYDWKQALRAYEEDRSIDIQAAHILSEFSFPRDKWMRIEFVARSILRKIVPPMFRGGWLKPLPIELVGDESLSFRDVLDATRWWTDRVQQSMKKDKIHTSIKHSENYESLLNILCMILDDFFVTGFQLEKKAIFCTLLLVSCCL